jgi:hypothetical protein
MAKGPLTSVVTNTGTEPVHINVPTISGADFAFATDAGTNDCSDSTVLNAGQSCDIRVTFDPTTVGMKSGTVTVPSDELPPLSIDLTGEGTQTSLSAPAIAFGKHDIDDPATTMTSVVTNNGTEDVTLDAAPEISGAAFTFDSAAAGDCASGTVLHKDDTCNVRVTFTPGTVGQKTGTVTIHTAELPDQSLALTGEGTQTELSRSPSSLDFGGQDIDSGPTGEQFSTVTNSGTEDVSITSVAVGGTDASDRRAIPLTAAPPRRSAPGRPARCG